MLFICFSKPSLWILGNAHVTVRCAGIYLFLLFRSNTQDVHMMLQVPSMTIQNPESVQPWRTPTTRICFQILLHGTCVRLLESGTWEVGENKAERISNDTSRSSSGEARIRVPTFFRPLGQMNPKGLLIFIPLSPKEGYTPDKVVWTPRKPMGMNKGYVLPPLETWFCTNTTAYQS